MIREVARHDWPKVREVEYWPMREVFVAYVAVVKERALENYFQASLEWVILAPWQGKRKRDRPKIPSILK